MILERKFILYIPIEPIPRSMGMLPLHCTVMPWFSLSESLYTHIRGLIGAVVERSPSIELISIRPALFGVDRTVSVHVLEPVPSLVRLHNALRIVLSDCGANFYAPQWVGSGYRPHVSNLDGKMFLPSSRVTARSVCLATVDKLERRHLLIEYVIGSQRKEHANKKNTTHAQARCE